jgi:hypothetical protein
VVQPKAITAKMLPQFRQLRSQRRRKPACSTRRQDTLPAGFSAADRKGRAEAGYRQAADSKIDAGAGAPEQPSWKRTTCPPAAHGRLRRAAGRRRLVPARIRNNTNLPT